MKLALIALVLMLLAGCDGKFNSTDTDSHVTYDVSGCAFVIQRDLAYTTASTPIPKFEEPDSLRGFSSRADRVINLDKPECPKPAK